MNTSLGAIPEMLYCNNGNNPTRFPDTTVKACAGMKWFRSNIRLGSRLALLALAIQFLLSFGHFHGDSASAASASRSGLHRAVAVAPSGASERVSHGNVIVPVRTKTPPSHVPLGHSNDGCAICVVMALANAMVDAAPPRLPTPCATAFSYGIVAVGFARPNSALVVFQPRAPPVA